MVRNTSLIAWFIRYKLALYKSCYKGPDNMRSNVSNIHLRC